MILISIGVIPMCIISFMITSSYMKQDINQKAIEIQFSLDKLVKLLSEKDCYDRDSLSEINDKLLNMRQVKNDRIIIIDNNLNIVVDTEETDIGKRMTSLEVINALKSQENKYQISKENQSIRNITPVLSEKDGTINGAIIVDASIESIYVLCDRMHQKTIAFVSALTILVFIFAFFYSRKVTNPLKRIVGTIDMVAEGDLDETLSVKGYTEIESIADSFNKMLSKLQVIENSRQEFVSNVSHELKTPITSIKILADSLLQQEDLPIELYREFLKDINDEIERENKIITDLLSLVKLDKTAGELNIKMVNINELLEQILKRLRPIASKRNIELIFESFRKVVAEVDEVKISLAVNNLIENAIKYNFDDGWVRVSLNADNKFFYIKVTDSGVGIPEDEQDNIFERFYRVDKARSRETGGTGLGLSITRNAILMHRGAIKVYSKENEGTTFTVRMHLTHAT